MTYLTVKRLDGGDDAVAPCSVCDLRRGSFCVSHGTPCKDVSVCLWAPIALNIDRERRKKRG